MDIKMPSQYAMELIAGSNRLLHCGGSDGYVQWISHRCRPGVSAITILDTAGLATRPVFRESDYYSVFTVGLEYSLEMINGHYSPDMVCLELRDYYGLSALSRLKGFAVPIVCEVTWETANSQQDAHLKSTLDLYDVLGKRDSTYLLKRA